MARDESELIELGRQSVNELFHVRPYDPVKRREQYLRTRQLKGRQSGSSKDPASSPGTVSGKLRGPGAVGGSGSAGMRPSRRKALLEEKAKLEKRLEVLGTALDRLVEAAKKRAGVDEPKTDKEDPKETAAKNEKRKKDSTLTEAEKREKRKASKEQYEKEKRTGLAQSVEQLHEQVRDMRAKIEDAVAEARERSKGPQAKSRSKTQTASNGR